MGKRTFAVLESSGVGLGFWGGLSTRQTDSMLPCLTTPKGTVKNKSRRLTKKGERGTGEERGVAESVCAIAAVIAPLSDTRRQTHTERDVDWLGGKPARSFRFRLGGRNKLSIGRGQTPDQFGMSSSSSRLPRYRAQQLAMHSKHGTCSACSRKQCSAVAVAAAERPECVCV